MKHEEKALENNEIMAEIKNILVEKIEDHKEPEIYKTALSIIFYTLSPSEWNNLKKAGGPLFARYSKKTKTFDPKIKEKPFFFLFQTQTRILYRQHIGKEKQPSSCLSFEDHLPEIIRPDINWFEKLLEQKNPETEATIQSSSPERIGLVCGNLIEYDRLETIQYFLKLGHTYDEKYYFQYNECHCHLLHHAAHYNRIAILEFLLNLHPRLIDIPIKSGALTGSSPLYVAAKNNSIDAVKLLVDRGSNINLRNENGFNVLEMAAEKNYTHFLRLFLTKKPTLAYEKEGAALILAAQAGSTEAVEILLKGNHALASVQNGRALILAADSGHTDIVEILLAENPALANSKNNVAIIYAAAKGHTRIIEILLEVDSDLVNAQQGQPLVEAILKGHMNVVEILLKNNCDTRQRDVIHLAATLNQSDIIKLLVKKDPALLSQKSKNLESIPLHYAIKSGHVEATKTLLILGSDPAILNKYKIDAIFLALHGAHSNTYQLIDLLQQYCSSDYDWRNALLCTILFDDDIALNILLKNKNLTNSVIEETLELAEIQKPCNVKICRLLKHKLEQSEPRKAIKTKPAELPALAAISSAPLLVHAIPQNKAIESKTQHLQKLAIKIKKNSQKFINAQDDVSIAQQRKFSLFTPSLPYDESVGQSRKQKHAAKQDTAHLLKLGYFRVHDEKESGQFLVSIHKSAFEKIPEGKPREKIISHLEKGTRFTRKKNKKEEGITLLEDDSNIYELVLLGEGMDGRLIGYQSLQKEHINLPSGQKLEASIIIFCEYASTHRAINRTIKNVKHHRARIIEEAKGYSIGTPHFIKS